MPGIQLYQTEVDELVLVRAAFERGCCLVPDLHLRSPEVQRLFNLEEFQNARLITRHFYIFGSSLAPHSLSIRPVEKENEIFYYVSSGVGTPSLEFLGGGIHVEPGTNRRLIRSGFLEFSREYWSEDLSRKLPSPPELEAHFLELSKVIKAHSLRIKPGKSVFWFGEDAKEQLQTGTKLVGYESWLPPSKSGLQPGLRSAAADRKMNMGSSPYKS